MGISPLNQLLIRPWHVCMDTFFFFFWNGGLCNHYFVEKVHKRRKKKNCSSSRPYYYYAKLDWWFGCNFKLEGPWIEPSMCALLKCDAEAFSWYVGRLDRSDTFNWKTHRSILGMCVKLRCQCHSTMNVLAWCKCFSMIKEITSSIIFNKSTRKVFQWWV